MSVKINYSILLDQDELLTNFNCGFYGEAVAQHLINLSQYEPTVPPAASPLASASPSLSPSPHRTFSWGRWEDSFFLHCVVLGLSVTKLPLKKKSFVISRPFSSLHHPSVRVPWDSCRDSGNAFLLFMPISTPGTLPSQLAASFSLVCPK